MRIKYSNINLSIYLSIWHTLLISIRLHSVNQDISEKKNMSDINTPRPQLQNEHMNSFVSTNILCRHVTIWSCLCTYVFLQTKTLEYVISLKVDLCLRDWMERIYLIYQLFPKLKQLHTTVWEIHNVNILSAGRMYPIDNGYLLSDHSPSKKNM